MGILGDIAAFLFMVIVILYKASNFPVSSYIASTITANTAAHIKHKIRSFV